MKIIDENGMIFGKINIIDLTVLLFLVILLFTGYKYLYLKNYPQNFLDQITEEPIFVLVNVTVVGDISPILFDAIKVGDTMNRTGVFERNVTIGTVIGKENMSSIKQDGQITANISYALFVEEKPEGYYFERQILRIPDIFLFSTSTYQTRGFITNIEKI